MNQMSGAQSVETMWVTVTGVGASSRQQWRSMTLALCISPGVSSSFPPPPPTAPSSAPQQSPTRCLAPLQAVKEAVSMATGPPASWAGPSSCRSLPGRGPGHRAPCPLLRFWVQPQAPVGAPTLGGRGRNFKLLKYSSKAPMWLVKPPKIITV